MTRKYIPVLTVALLLGFLTSLAVMAGVPEGMSGRSNSKSLLKPSDYVLEAFIPNRINTDVINRGQFVSWNRTGNAGMEWPAGSGNTINFASGVWLVGKVAGEVRSAAAEYSVEFDPGNVVDGVPADPNDSRFRIYQIRDDSNLELTRDDFPEGAGGDTEYDDYLRYREDWLNWPVQDGAPVDANGDPLLLGSKALWCVFNDFDPAAHANLWSTKPLGVEVQMYLWGFNRADGFGDMMFMKFTIINKGGNTIDSSYVSLWDDPDMGDSADDFVAVDTTTSLGYCWNDGADGVYGVRAPAIGYDFFQGPIVASAGDTAIFNFKELPGFRNLPMTAFAKYINGGGNDKGDPEDAVQALNYMRGTNRIGVPYVNPVTGLVTKFVDSGDPVTGVGWLDPDDDPSGDRRFLMTTGPFTMAPGDTQEVVGGMIIAQATNNLTSITKLRQLDEAAQSAYDRNFALPPTPPAPTIKVRQLDDRIVLEWGDAAESYDVADLIGRQAFEGYNVYQISGPQVSAATPAIRIATFDKVDDLSEGVRDVVFTDEGEVDKVVQPLSNNGLQHFYATTVDETRGRAALINGRNYWFAVTAFGVNPDGSTAVGVPKVLESPMKVIQVTPQAAPLGTTYPMAYGDSVDVAHVQGKSDGYVIPVVVDPSSTTGDEYRVNFAEAEGGGITWSVTDATANVVKVSGLTNQAGGENYPIVDGVLVKVFGPPVEIAGGEDGSGIVEVAYGGEPIPSEGYDGLGAPFHGNCVWHSLNWAGPEGSDRQRYYLSSTVNGDITRLERWIDYAVPYDYELRFTAAGGYGVYAFTDDKIATTPFELWNIGIGTPDDPSDDVRMIPFLLENDTTAAAWGWANGVEPVFQAPVSDAIYWMDPQDFSPGSISYDKFDSVCVAVGAGNTYPYATDGSVDGYWADFHGGFVYPIGRLTVADYSEAGHPPPAGSTVRIVTNKPNAPSDVFTYSTRQVAYNAETAKTETDLINVFPNPYYARNAEETNPLQRFVTFSHLPDEATIRIFTLAGDLIAKIDHQGGQFETWDLRNRDGIPVASGIYIVHISLGQLGADRILKIAVFMPEERLDVL